MKNKSSRRKKYVASKAQAAPQAHGGRTRSPDAPLDKSLIDSFIAVEPAGFGDHPRSAIEAAAVDPDVDDSKGGE